MITFANAKINIGLQVLHRRDDGYHELETVFYPLKIFDVLEVVEAPETRLIPSGLPIPGNGQDNLCLKAYYLLQREYDLPPVQIYLHKTIPIGAGLGGGSADAAFLLKLVNEKFNLGLSESELMRYALQLGADCSFFIHNKPVLATGIGDVFKDITVDLSPYRLIVIKPTIHVSTKEAYSAVTPDSRGRQLAAAIALPVEEWRDAIVNDFEAGIFSKHPQIKALKTLLYEQGAIFAAMSGSGSSVYGLFKEKVTLSGLNQGYTVFHVD